MKKSKIIVPALGILVLSTAAAVTGTVAWFTSNNTLSVTGMQAKVDAENGIVVSNEAKSVWATSAVAQHSGEDQSFLLTSTADLAAWYHNKSDNANDHTAAEDYTTLTVTKPAAGTQTTNTGIGTATYNQQTKNVYLINRFYIQSASGLELTGQDLKVKNIAATGASGSAELDKALRVAFKSAQTSVIYAPFAGASLSYNVAGAATATTIVDGSLGEGEGATGDTRTLLSNVTIPTFIQSGNTALEIEVYVFFEGEDPAAKSANITANLDDLTVSFEFENAIHA